MSFMNVYQVFLVLRVELNFLTYSTAMLAGQSCWIVSTKGTIADPTTQATETKNEP